MRAFFERPEWTKGVSEVGVDVGGKDVDMDDVEGTGVGVGVAEGIAEDGEGVGRDVTTVVIVVTNGVLSVADVVGAGEVSPPYVQSESSGICRCACLA
jgi:hypothetical protein